MDKCPNCGKNAVEDDQCLVCGIVVSKWLKLYSTEPVEPIEDKKSDQPKPPSPSLNPQPEKKASPSSDRSGGDLQPPSFVFDQDATIKLSDDINTENQDFLPIEFKSADETKEKEESKKQPPPPASIFASTEAEVAKLRKDLKTDWEKHYQSMSSKKKERTTPDDLVRRFNIRNYMISGITFALSAVSVNLFFITRFGFTLEYGAMITIVNVLALIGLALSAVAIFYFRGDRVVDSVKKDTEEESSTKKVPFLPLHMVEIVIAVTLILLLPLNVPIAVRKGSTFPIRTDVEEEFLTGDVLGTYFKPVLGKDKSLYVLQTYGQKAGLLARMTKKGDFETVIDELQMLKFRFLNDGELMYLYMGSMKILPLPRNSSQKIVPQTSIKEIFEDYAISDFDISQDGEHLMFCSDGDLFYSAKPFETALNVSNTPNKKELMPSISSDGRSVLFVQDVRTLEEQERDSARPRPKEDIEEMSGAQLDSRGRYQIFSYDVVSSEIQRLTTDDFNYNYPLFTPDMRYITAVVITPGPAKLNLRGVPYRERVLVLMNPNGTAKVRIFPPLDLPISSMEECFWSPEGNVLYIGISGLLDKAIYKLKFL